MDQLPEKQSLASKSTKHLRSRESFGMELIKPPLASTVLQRIIAKKDTDRLEMHNFLRRETGIPPDSVLWKINLDNVRCARELRNYILCSESHIHCILCKDYEERWIKCINGVKAAGTKYG